MATEVFRSVQEPEKQLAHYSLLDALLARRSRRFGKGMRLNGGPLAYESAHEPAPLSLTEEAALAFAACGVTGFTMGELPYDDDPPPQLHMATAAAKARVAPLSTRDCIRGPPEA